MVKRKSVSQNDSDKKFRMNKLRSDPEYKIKEKEVDNNNKQQIRIHKDVCAIDTLQTKRKKNVEG